MMTKAEETTLYWIGLYKNGTDMRESHYYVMAKDEEDAVLQFALRDKDAFRYILSVKPVEGRAFTVKREEADEGDS